MTEEWAYIYIGSISTKCKLIVTDANRVPSRMPFAKGVVWSDEHNGFTTMANEQRKRQNDWCAPRWPGL
jgi:hypothetical protein